MSEKVISQISSGSDYNGLSKRIAIFGATGMLGSSLVEEAEKNSLQIIRVSNTRGDLKKYAKVDITNPDSISFFINEWKPEIIINCSAYTNVDQAEISYDQAFLVNSIGPKNLAKACKENGIYLIHISTDYVFGGSRVQYESEPFTETELTHPVGIYGYSKYFGEQLIKEIHAENSLIIRTSWLHGPHGKNFIDTIVNASSQKPELRVVNDQVGSLTYTGWLTKTIYKLIDNNLTGVVHASASDECSWFDAASYVVSKVGNNCKIFPQSTEESGRPAPRPAYSKLAVTSLEFILQESIPTWKDMIDLHLNKE